MGGAVSITSATSTETQIVLTYVTNSPSPCTISLTDNNDGVNPPNDLNPVLFSNANVDLARTTSAGYRWPTIVSADGLTRTVILGGHDETKLAFDGKWYSTALQAASPHTIGLSCNNGADTATTSLSTSNIPLGSTYPETPIPAPGSPMGGLAQPTIDWGDRTKKYIDSITGVLIQRVTGGADNFDDTNPVSGSLLSPVIDVDNRGEWSNANSFITNQASGTLASTSTPNAPLFTAINYSPPGTEYFSDFLVTPYGSASTNGVTSEWCISTDSGQTCANYTPIDVNFSTSTQCQPSGLCASSAIPSSTPSSNFSAWGGMKVAFGTYDLSNFCFNPQGSAGCQGASVSAGGSTVTIDQASVYPGFNLDRVAGTKFLLSSCASGADTMLTVASVNSTNQITVQETFLNLQHCNYQEYAVGIRVIMKTSGTLNVSFQQAAWAGRSYSSGSNGSYYPCARSKVRDIQIDCDGKTQDPPLSGYLCSLNGSIYLVQDNGRMCLQSNGYNLRAAHISQAFGFYDARTYLGRGFENPPHTWNVQHVPNNYAEYAVDPRHLTQDRFTYTDITNINPISPQIAAAGGPVADALNTGLWPPMSLDTLLDDGNGGAVIQYRSTAGPINSSCMLAWADAATNTLKSSVALFGGYPFSSSACHFAPDGGAGFSRVGVEAEDSQIGPFFANPSILLGGPFLSSITSIHQNGSAWQNWSLPITAAIASKPALLTSPGNDLITIRSSALLGSPITCSGATGSWTMLNGNFYAHRMDNDRFTLFNDPQGASPLDATSASGTLTGVVTCSTSPPLYSVNISAVNNNGGNARMTANLSGGYANDFPSGRLVIRDGDPITITQFSLNSTTQYYAKVSDAPSGQFDVYTDSALTSPASYDSLSGAANSYATYAETCPDPATVTLPGPMYTDTGFGTTGAGNQKVRCVTLRLSTEPESYFPGAGEHMAYPPPATSAEAGDPKRSMLHQINVGDAFGDIWYFPDANHELFYVINIDRSAGENQIDVTLERDYGDDWSYDWRGATNGISRDYYSHQHAIGWSAWAQAAVPGGLVSTNSPTIYAIPPINGAHFDLVSGSVNGTITTASGYSPAVPDDIVDGTLDTLTAPSISTHNSIPVWSGGAGYVSGPMQSYPSKRTVAGEAPLSEMVWKGDWMAMNQAFGFPQNNGDSINWTRSMTNIRGTTYDSASTTTSVWKITPIGGINIKLTPVMVQNLPHGYYSDKSGPNSVIKDSDAGSFCIAYTAGECRPNSSQWDIFFSATRIFNWPGCRANEATLGTPCAFGVNPGGGWAVQIQQTPVDTNATGVRRLTQAWWLPPNHFSFSNWVASPDGKWGFFANNPVQQRPRKSWTDGVHFFAMKLPPWPDSVPIPALNGVTPDRTNFIKYPALVFAPGGDTVRISFGYGENGDVSKFYCTSRLETCWTSDAATPSNPYVFDSESQTRTNCNLGCTVSLPAIAGRVLYYRVEHADGTTDPIQVVAIP